MAWLAISSLRSGELIKFQSNIMAQTMVDMLAEVSPEARSLKYVERQNSPIRFWLGVGIRLLLAIAGLLMSIYFLAAAVSGHSTI